MWGPHGRTGQGRGHSSARGCAARPLQSHEGAAAVRSPAGRAEPGFRHPSAAGTRLAARHPGGSAGPRGASSHPMTAALQGHSATIPSPGPPLPILTPVVLTCPYCSQAALSGLGSSSDSQPQPGSQSQGRPLPARVPVREAATETRGGEGSRVGADEAPPPCLGAQAAAQAES